MDSVFDIMIVGGGPAGLSAAAALVRQDHKAVLFDSAQYRNAAAKYMHAMPTWDHEHPAKFRAKIRAELTRYNCVTVVDAPVKTIKKRGDGLFEAEAAGKTYTAKKVVLATGVVDQPMDVPGYAENWGVSIFHCLYCHGWEQRGGDSVGVVADAVASSVLGALHFGRNALRLAKQATIYTNGNEQLAKDLAAELEKHPAPFKIKAAEIVRFVRLPEGSLAVHLADGTAHTETFVAHHPAAPLRGDLHKQLGLELTEMGRIKTNGPMGNTSVEGVHAAGDVAGFFEGVANAVTTGGFAAIGGATAVQAEQYGHKSFFDAPQEKH